MPPPPLLKRDWEKDHVYLIQLPRAGIIPSPSPFALKLETWLRMNQIPYTNISNDFKKTSSKGQIPFVEVNGRQIADSNFIIDELIKEFHKETLDGRLTPVERAYARMLHDLMEESIRWTLVYSRARDASWFSTEQGFAGHVSGIKKFIAKYIIGRKIQNRIKSTAQLQGVGRLTPEEMLIVFKKDLEAASMFLGNKKFFFGDRPTTVDCTAFAHLAELFYTPQFTDEIKTLIVEKYQNIHQFIERMRAAYWSDWEEATSTLKLDTKWND